MTSEYTTKSRTETTTYPPDLKYQLIGINSPGSSLIADYSKDFHPISIRETMTSRGNPGWNRGPGHYSPPNGARWANSDRGGTCFHQKYDFAGAYYPVRKYVRDFQAYATTPVWTSRWGCVGDPAWFIDSWHANIISDKDLITLGTNLSSRLNPLRPRASLFTTLVELKREGLPNLRSAFEHSKGFKSWAPAAGEDWLNFSFGLKPLWNDLMSLCQVMLDVEDLIIQFQRDNGRLVRRHTTREPSVVSDERTETPSYGEPVMFTSAYLNGKAGQLITTKTRTRETWFSGAFKYTLPSGNSLLSQAQSLNVEARYLLGLSFDPKTLWSVLGWSWLVDWIVNIGSVLENFTQRYLDDSVMAYGYIMSKDLLVYRQDLILFMNAYGGGTYTVTPSAQGRWSTFKRLQASPFGFGVNWTGFSPFQLSILSSLAITRGRP